MCRRDLGGTSSPSGDRPLGLRHLGPSQGHRGQASLRGLVSRPDVADPGPSLTLDRARPGDSPQPVSRRWLGDPWCGAASARAGGGSGARGPSPSQRGAFVSARPAGALAHLSCPSFKVSGRAALQSTTLQSLGLTGGSASIRWGLWSLRWGKRGLAGKKTEGVGTWRRTRAPVALGPSPLPGVPLPARGDRAGVSGLCPLWGRARTPLGRGRTGRAGRPCRGLDSVAWAETRAPCFLSPAPSGSP